jgi:4-hydroxy-tetrahydrodipicolinate reductase
MKIALLGYGKMGRAIEAIALQEGDEVILKIDADNTDALTPEAIVNADVAIEFSRPESAFDNIRLCLENAVPVVSGTTGWLDRFEEAKTVCAQSGGAFFYASNFSIGVNIFFAVNRMLAKMMGQQPGYEVSMEETHHIHKLDAPSGTAITLANDIIENMPGKKNWLEGDTNDESVVPIQSFREGEVPGTHVITYDSPIDSIRIEHEAHSREGFARGALQAARWLVGKQGVFGMEDMLGL